MAVNNALRFQRNFHVFCAHNYCKIILCSHCNKLATELLRENRKITVKITAKIASEVSGQGPDAQGILRYCKWEFSADVHCLPNDSCTPFVFAILSKQPSAD